MTRRRYWKQMDQLVGKNLWSEDVTRSINGSAIRITALTSSGPKWSPERRCRFETLKRCWCKLFHVKRRLWIYATGVQRFWHCVTYELYRLHMSLRSWKGISKLAT